MIFPVPGLTIEQQPLTTLASMLCWGEARGEGDLGMLAVLCVALNRAYPGALLEPVVSKAVHGDDGLRLHNAILRRWAFSCFNDEDPNRGQMLEPLKHDAPRVWHAATAIVSIALEDGVRDVTCGATHYCTASLWNEPGKKWHQHDEIAAGRTVETWRHGRHVFARAA